MNFVEIASRPSMGARGLHCQSSGLAVEHGAGKMEFQKANDLGGIQGFRIHLLPIGSASARPSVNCPRNPLDETPPQARSGFVEEPQHLVAKLQVPNTWCLSLQQHHVRHVGFRRFVFGQSMQYQALAGGFVGLCPALEQGIGSRTVVLGQGEIAVARQVDQQGPGIARIDSVCTAAIQCGR